MSVLEPPAAQTSLPIDYDKRLMLFSGRANPALAAGIANKLGVDLGEITLTTFANGEVYCRYGESIRGADIFIVQPTCANPVTGISANDALMELLVMIDAAVGASAHRVIAVTPWFAYSRQDKKSAPREPISARLVAHMLEAAGVDRVLTMDLHAGQVQGFFNKPVDHMTGHFMLTQYFADLKLPDLVVVAPDVGRAKLNQKFAEQVGADLAILTRERPRRGAAELGYLIGDVRGKTAVVVDDIIDTGSTLRAAAQALIEGGASRILAAATHAVFSGDALARLADLPFEQIVVTDTIPARRDAPANVIVLPCADLLTDSIRRIFTDGSVSEVFGGENQLFWVSSPVGVLMDRLGLTDDEALAVFEVDPLTLISGQLAHRPELEILVSLTAAAADRVGEPLLRRWLRADGPAGRPIALLRSGDFAGFEDALAVLVERGLVIGGDGRREG